MAVGRNAEVGRPRRGAPRRAHVAGGHQTFAGRRQVHTPARVRSGAAGRARARPQKIAQHARACVCSPGARGRGAGAGGRCSACPMRGRAVHMAAGAAPLLRRARRAAVRDGHSRRAWASQTRCGPLGRAAPRRSPGARAVGCANAQGRCWRAFCMRRCGCARALTRAVCTAVLAQRIMPFSATFSAAAPASERLRPRSVAGKLGRNTRRRTAHATACFRGRARPRRPRTHANGKYSQIADFGMLHADKLLAILCAAARC